MSACICLWYAYGALSICTSSLNVEVSWTLMFDRKDAKGAAANMQR